MARAAIRMPRKDVVKLLLMHNPSAGSASLSSRQLRRAFEKADHEMECQSVKKTGWKKSLKREFDAIVVAGGDGTVRSVALALAANGSDTPLVILPMGTANNVARSVGADESAERAAAGLSNARREWLAIGLVRGPGDRECNFIESAGLGVFPHMLRKADAKNVDTMEEGLELLHRAVEKAEPRYVHVEADGVVLSGEYLMVEAMNVASIGPRLELAPSADHGDDRLDLILVGPDKRDALADYLVARVRGESAAFPVKSRRVRRIRMDWDSDSGHVDDQPWPEKAKKTDTCEAIIQVERHLPLLIP